MRYAIQAEIGRRVEISNLAASCGRLSILVRVDGIESWTVEIQEYKLREA